MEGNNLNIHLAGESGIAELVIREGQAMKLQEPLAPDITGSIEAPAVWAEEMDFGRDLAHAKVFPEDGKIILKEDSRNIHGGKVIGIIKTTDVLKSFGINESKYYTSKELAKFLKRNRMYFLDRDEGTEIIGQLNAFKAKVDKEIEIAQNNRGGKKNLLEQVVESNAPESFKLYLPIIGIEKRSFTVEVGLDVTDGGVKFWLESVELIELIQEEIESSIGEVTKRLEAAGITLIYSA